MNNKIEIIKNTEKLNKINRALVGGSVFCMFSYVILLGLTAANVVTLRNTSKIVEDSKTELGQVELSYMSVENMMALETESKANFAEPENIAYVTDSSDNSKQVAVLDSRN